MSGRASIRQALRRLTTPPTWPFGRWRSPIPFYREMNVYVPRWREYLRRVIAEDIDVLHLTTPGPMGLAALWIATRTGLPLVGSFTRTSRHIRRC